jgi:hypothetical protein
MTEEERMGESWEDDDKESTRSYDEYMNREDRRRRKKERLLNAPFIESDNFRVREVHGKDCRLRAVQFRVSPFAEKVGSEVAALFGMSLSQYAKAVLYRDLGLIFEPIDRRRKKK